MYNVEFFYANMGYPYPTDFRYPTKKVLEPTKDSRTFFFLL